MPSHNELDFTDSEHAPEVPLAIIAWLTMVYPAPEIVAYRSEREWDFLAGIEEVRRTLQQTFDDQADQGVRPGDGTIDLSEVS